MMARAAASVRRAATGAAARRTTEFVVQEDQYQGRMLPLIGPDAAQIAQWVCDGNERRCAHVERLGRNAVDVHRIEERDAPGAVSVTGQCSASDEDVCP